MRYALRVGQLPSHPTFPSFFFSSSTLETFDSGVTRGAKPICVRVANLMEDADIDVDSVTPLTPNRAQSWFIYYLFISQFATHPRTPWLFRVVRQQYTRLHRE